MTRLRPRNPDFGLAAIAVVKLHTSNGGWRCTSDIFGSRKASPKELRFTKQMRQSRRASEHPRSIMRHSKFSIVLTDGQLELILAHEK
jgi:hypothetical protein